MSVFFGRTNEAHVCPEGCVATSCKKGAKVARMGLQYFSKNRNVLVIIKVVLEV